MKIGMHYLDHNATSPLRPEAREAMARALAVTGNPSSVHACGREARALVEGARRRIAARIGLRAQDLVFTSGATEANALALWGAVQGAAEAGERITRLFVSAIEHSSVLANATAIAERAPGVRLATLPVTPAGVVDVGALRDALREGKGRALVAVMAANNETGVIQPIDEISKAVREADALLLVDAVQKPDTVDADFVSLSAHKLGGPMGVGALGIRDGVPFAAQMLGGGHERGLRAGTENVAGIAGFGAVADVAPIDAALRDRFEAGLPTSSVVFGKDAPRLPGTSNFALPAIAADTALMALDLDGVMVSSGAACSSGKVKRSHVLVAMGVAEEIARSALRVSFGWNSTEADADAALASIARLVARREAA
jgi:cysteine desulfurase